MLEPVCPECCLEVTRIREDAVRCSGCGMEYPVRGTVPVFLRPDEYAKVTAELEQTAWLWKGYLDARRNAALTRQYYDWWANRLLAELPAGFGGPVLELMSGAIEIGRRLPASVDGGMAIDLNICVLERAAAELASTESRRITVVCGTAARLPLRTGSVPAILIQGGLHHVRPILSSVVEEIARVLEPGGLLIASEPADDNAIIRAIRTWQYRRSDKQGFDEQGFTRRELHSLLGGVGLNLRKYVRFGHVAYPLMGNTDLLPILARSHSHRLGRALLRVDQWCGCRSSGRSDLRASLLPERTPDR